MTNPTQPRPFVRVINTAFAVALAKAAATSHQQVRIAALSREVETQRIRNEQLEVSFRVLAQERGVGERPQGA
jgi:hypothetical protein